MTFAWGFVALGKLAPDPAAERRRSVTSLCSQRVQLEEQLGGARVSVLRARGERAQDQAVQPRRHLSVSGGRSGGQHAVADGTYGEQIVLASEGNAVREYAMMIDQSVKSSETSCQRR
jgi:hypothetical protein